MQKNLYKKNKLLQIAGFCATVEEGSISKASRKLNTAQSNVSLQVSTFENDLAMQLFINKNNKLMLTDEGERVYKISKSLLINFEGLFSDTFVNIKRDFDSVLHIASHPFMLSHVLPKYFTLAKEQNKNVIFNLWNTEYDRAIDMLLNQTVDIAFFPADIKNLPHNIEAIEFYKCFYTIVMRKDHPLASVDAKDLSWDLLSEYDFITLNKGITAQGLKGVINKFELNSSFILHNGTWEICKGLVMEGLTMSGADISYIKNIPNTTYKVCPHLLPDYKFYALINREGFISKASSDFLDVIRRNHTDKFFS